VNSLTDRSSISTIACLERRSLAVGLRAACIRRSTGPVAERFSKFVHRVNFERSIAFQEGRKGHSQLHDSRPAPAPFTVSAPEVVPDPVLTTVTILDVE